MEMENYNSYKIDNRNAEKKKRFIKKLFDSITGPYDILNRLLSMGIDVVWRKKMIKISGPLKNKKTLDICCGTGDVSLMLHKNGAKTFSVDFSENMLKRGLEKKAIKGFPIASDACRMPFKRDSFDMATIAFGIRNIPDIDNFIGEANRTLKPGGKLVILELSMPGKKIVKFFYSFYLKKAVPFLGGIISGKKSAYNYLAGTISTFIGPQTLVKMLEQKKFKGAKIFPQTFGVATIIICEKDFYD